MPPPDRALKAESSQPDDLKRPSDATRAPVRSGSTMERDQVVEAYEQHSGGLARFLVGVLRDDALAADALQNTYARLIEKGADVELRSIRSWLFRVAFNEAMLIKRKDAAQTRKVDNAAWTLIKNQQQKDTDATAAAMRRERVQRLKAALDRLPDEQRKIVVMRIYDGLKFKDISQTLQLPLGTVLSRMQLALKKLRLAIPDEE